MIRIDIFQHCKYYICKDMPNKSVYCSGGILASSNVIFNFLLNVAGTQANAVFPQAFIFCVYIQHLNLPDNSVDCPLKTN